MTRSNSAARVQRSGESQPEASKPANDTAQNAGSDDARPASVLSAAQRAHYLLLAANLRVAASVRLPTWVNDHLDWMDELISAAWTDRAELAKVALGGRPIIETEIDDFSLRVEFAREVIADVAVPSNGAPATNDPTTMSDAALDAEMRLCQNGICDGLVPWFPFSPAASAEVDMQRKAVQQVRRNRARASLVANDLLLFKVCDDKAILAWLRGLPKGEAALLERLRVLHRERVRRNKGARPAGVTTTMKDLPVRAYALAREPVKRITAAGRYLVKGRPEREGDYAGFKRPVSPKRAADEPAHPVSDPVTPPVVR